MRGGICRCILYATIDCGRYISIDMVHGFFLLFPGFSSCGKVMSDECVEDHAAHCRMARKIILEDIVGVNNLVILSIDRHCRTQWMVNRVHRWPLQAIIDCARRQSMTIAGHNRLCDMPIDSHWSPQ